MYEHKDNTYLMKKIYIKIYFDHWQHILYIIFIYNIESKLQNNVNLYLTSGQYVMLHSWCTSRPYTPITWTRKSLVLLVKVYKNGKFSTQLKNAPLGSSIDVRGPYGDFIYKTNRCVKNIRKKYK